jgi:hypothetical protein
LHHQKPELKQKLRDRGYSKIPKKEDADALFVPTDSKNQPSNAVRGINSQAVHDVIAIGVASTEKQRAFKQSFIKVLEFNYTAFD